MPGVISICLLSVLLITPVFAQKNKKPPRARSSVAASIADAPPKPLKITDVTGALDRYENFPARVALRRGVDVWLPPGYEAEAARRYAVVYMHDGQNLFRAADAFGGVEWKIDETLARLIAEKAARPAIVVGIWNTPYRFTEYAPQRAADLVNRRRIEPSSLVRVPAGESDKYLQFIVGELKPFVDRVYRTKPERADNFVMGSSMGGLMSLYAVSEYPNVFGGAGCVSTHFPLGDGVMLEYMRRFLPSPKNHRIYFDYGTRGLDADYEPLQIRADEIMRAKGYQQNLNWVTRKFDGADHNEKSWAERAAEPLLFLLRE